MDHDDIYDFLLGEKKKKNEIAQEISETGIPLESQTVSSKKKMRKTTAVKGKLEILKEMILEESLMAVRFSYCTRYVIVGLGNGLIKMLSVSTGLDFADLDILCETPCTDIAIIHPMNDSESKSKFVAVYSNGLVAVWDFLKCRNKPLACWSEEDRNIKAMNHTLCCSVSGDSMRIATGGDGSVIRIMSLDCGDMLMKCFPAKKPNVTYGKQMRISSIKYDPRGKVDEYYSHVFYSANWDNCIYIWNDECCSPLWRYRDIQVNGACGFDLCDRTNEIAAGNWSTKKGILKIWLFSHSLVKPEPGEDLTQYTAPIMEYHQTKHSLSAKAYVTLYTPDGKYILFGGCKENIFVVLDRETLTSVGSLRNLSSGILGADYATCLDDPNKFIVACITENTIILLGIPKAN